MKGYNGYFLLEYLIDQSMKQDKIIYNGSKIMYMTIEKDLHIKIIDSLNFLPMKLSKLLQAFGLKEPKEGWFPHFFNTRDNQEYVGPSPAPIYSNVTLWETRKEKNAWHGSNPKRSASSNLRNKCWITAEMMWTFYIRHALSFENC